jgi:cytoskeleton protein RodZ
MNAEIVEATETETTDFVGPGDRLRTVREAQGLGIEQVAEQLHLTKTVLQDMESNDYEKLPSPVFVRGYLRNYARLLGLPEEPILDAYKASGQCGRGEALDLTGKCVGKTELRGSSHRGVKLMSWIIVVGLLVLVLSWWKGYLQWPPQQEADRAESENMDQPMMPAPGDTTDDGTLPLPWDATPDPSGEDRSGAPREEADTSMEVAEPTVEPEQPVAAETVAAVEPAETVAEEITSEPVAETAPEPEAVVTEAAPAAEAETVSEPAVEPVAKRVEFAFAGTSWMEVRDSTGRIRMIGEYRGGTTHELDGKPPFNMVIGNAEGVRMNVNGSPFDFTPHVEANVARFKFDPNTIDRP